MHPHTAPTPLPLLVYHLERGVCVLGTLVLCCSMGKNFLHGCEKTCDEAQYGSENSCSCACIR